MNRLTPNLAVRARHGAGLVMYHFAFYLPRGAGYSVRCKAATLQADPLDVLSVDVDSLPDSMPQELVVVAMRNDDRSTAAELARVTVGSDIPEDFEADLRDAVQQAFFDAMRDMTIGAAEVTEVAATAPGAASVAAVPGKKRGTGRYALMAAVLLGAGLVGYGAYASFFHPTAPVTAAAAMSGTQDYSGLQAKIQKEIMAAAMSPTPAVNGVNGQKMDNVAIETMKAMGLDPGKANAGCLVGVK